MALRVGLLHLLRLTLKRAPSPAQQLLEKLGNPDGSVSAPASGLDGIAKFALK